MNDSEKRLYTVQWSNCIEIYTFLIWSRVLTSSHSIQMYSNTIMKFESMSAFGTLSDRSKLRYT